MNSNVNIITERDGNIVISLKLEKKRRRNLVDEPIVKNYLKNKR